MGHFLCRYVTNYQRVAISNRVFTVHSLDPTSYAYIVFRTNKRDDCDVEHIKVGGVKKTINQLEVWEIFTMKR